MEMFLEICKYNVYAIGLVITGKEIFKLGKHAIDVYKFTKRQNKKLMMMDEYSQSKDRA